MTRAEEMVRLVIEGETVVIKGGEEVGRFVISGPRSPPFSRSSRSRQSPPAGYPMDPIPTTP